MFASYRSLTILPLFLLAPLGIAANTWVVDDDGGAGVDFLTVSAAVAAANHGDTVLVRDGFYPETVTSDKGLTLRGDTPSVSIYGNVQWTGMGPGRRLQIRDLDLRRLSLDACAGTVLVEGVTLDFLSNGVFLSGCSDVRFSDCGLDEGVKLDATRAEFVDCTITGYDGWDGGLCDAGGPGGDALELENASSAFVARCSLIGGRGGDTWSNCGDFGGDGGHGVLVDATSELVLSGFGTDFVLGGDAGAGQHHGDDGIGGDGIASEGFVRHSGVTIAGGESPDYIDGDATSGSGLFEEPASPDPVIVPDGVATPGGVVTLTVHGEQGQTVRMLIGRNPEWVLAPGIIGPRLLDPIRVVPIGNIGGSGTRSYNLALPGNLPLQSLLLVQARLTSGGGSLHTHSITLFVQ